MNDRLAWGLAAVTAALRLTLVDRFDVFRDELYFIACGRHPALGYVDQPPLIPLLAAGAYGLGAHLWLLRLPGILAAGALVWLTVAFVRLLKGRNAAAWAAGLAVALAPMFLGLTATLNTTTFEPLAWTGLAYALARAVLLDDRRALIWGGALAGIALETKYAIASWLLALAVGVLATPQRRLFARRALWLGLALTVTLAAPSVVWQAAHGFPFRQLVAGAAQKNIAVPPLAFIANQVLVLNPVFAPLWVAGIVAPFALRDLRPLRFLAIAYLVEAALIMTTSSKDYYLAAAYPTLFALGAVTFERIVRLAWLRVLYLAFGFAAAALIAPLAIPILDPAPLVTYERALHLAPVASEKSARSMPIPQTFADQLGWHDFVREIAAAYDAVPASKRTHTAILVENYGEAAAIDVYGPSAGLPPPLSGHNQYFLWGLRGQLPANVVFVKRDAADLEDYCTSIRPLGTTFSPYAMPYENGKTIALCSGIRPALAELWPLLQDYE
jgi:hypothetical protein